MATPPLQRSRRPSFKDSLRHQKWLTLIGLPTLLTSSFLGFYTLWGLLFVFWGMVSLRTGQVYLLETIYREDDPALYWIIVIMWLASGGLYVLGDVYPSIWS